MASFRFHQLIGGKPWWPQNLDGPDDDADGYIRLAVDIIPPGTWPKDEVGFLPQ